MVRPSFPVRIFINLWNIGDIMREKIGNYGLPVCRLTTHQERWVKRQARKGKEPIASVIRGLIQEKIDEEKKK